MRDFSVQFNPNVLLSGARVAGSEEDIAKQTALLNEAAAFLRENVLPRVVRSVCDVGTGPHLLCPFPPSHALCFVSLNPPPLVAVCVGG